MEDKVNKIIEDKLQSFQNLSVPVHIHNGVDSPVIPIKNIQIVPNLGIPFSNGSQISYNMYIIDQADGSGLVIEPNTGTFGGVGGTLFLGGGFKNDGIFSGITGIVGDGTNTTSFNLFPGSFSFVQGPSGAFSLDLPATSQPPAIAGGIYFDGTNFFVCKDGINWILLI